MRSQTKNKSAVKIVFGLGNPDDEHRLTYHNAGRLFLEHLLGETADFRTPVKKPFAFTEKNGLVFAISNLYMNQSGAAVYETLRFFKFKKEKLLIVHDDADLPLGDYRFSQNASSAGHRGVQSVIDVLKSQDFLRLRFGIRFPLAKRAESFVLKNISVENLEKLKAAFSTAEKELWEKYV